MSAGRGRTKIGELGGAVDINSILNNLLGYDGMIASDMTNSQWVSKVMPGSDWGLKDKLETIFGAAWAFDQDKNDKNNTDNNTFFRYNDFQIDGKFNAADVGNYHAGYTGIAADVEQITGEGYKNILAIKDATISGLRDNYSSGQMTTLLKNMGQGLRRGGELISSLPPTGDQKVDFIWNTRGMAAAVKAGYSLSQ